MKVWIKLVEIGQKRQVYTSEKTFSEEETKNERITENGLLQPTFKGSSFSNYSIFGTKPEDKPPTQFGKSAFGGEIAKIHCVPKRSRIASVVAGHGICAQKIQ